MGVVNKKMSYQESRERHLKYVNEMQVVVNTLKELLRCYKWEYGKILVKSVFDAKSKIKKVELSLKIKETEAEIQSKSTYLAKFKKRIATINDVTCSK